MEWSVVGSRIRKQREFFGYTREQFAEMLDVTPKFCSDIELGLKGMSVPTLCRISEALKLSTDYILFGEKEQKDVAPLTMMLNQCPAGKLPQLETIVKAFLVAAGK